jgi:hypothetical protein
MATVEEILRQAGYSDSQIAGLDRRTITAFSGVLTEAQQAREAAEQAHRSYVEFYENRIAPSLVQWDEEKTRIENDRTRDRAELAFYKTQAEEARTAGFIPGDAPGYQPRDDQGRYVAGAPGSTPGSPTFDVNQVYQRAGDAINVLSDIQWEHERLFGQPLPVSPSELVKRADQMKLDPRTYASREFHWNERKAEMAKEAQQKHDDGVRAERDRYWAEKVGSNPDVRLAQSSRYSDAARAVRAGTRPDPLMMTELDRRRATAQAIRDDLAQEVR